MNKAKIVCMGDSLTEGYQIKPGSCWPSLLNAEPNLEIINSGICGDTTAGMLSRFQQMVISHQPDYVIIMGGTNDIWFNTPDSQIIGNILAMTRHARHHKIQSIIGIPTTFYLPEVSDEEHFFMDLKGMKLRLTEYENILRKFIYDDKQPMIDFSRNINSALFLEDGLHPNEAGHAVMAKNAKQSLIKILAK
jgi:lysophospholipase L1-like esterase